MFCFNRYQVTSMHDENRTKFEPESKLWIHNAIEQNSALTIEETHKSACYARNTILHLWLASLWSRVFVYNSQESWRNWFALVGSQRSFHACNSQSLMKSDEKCFQTEYDESENAGRNKMHSISALNSRIFIKIVLNNFLEKFLFMHATRGWKIVGGFAAHSSWNFVYFENF